MPPKRQHQKPPPGCVFIEDYRDNNGNITPGIATRLGLAAGTYRKWRMTGKGPATFKLGKRVVARESDVDVWFARQANAAVTPRHEMRPPEPRTVRRRPNRATKAKNAA